MLGTPTWPAVISGTEMRRPTCRAMKVKVVCGMSAMTAGMCVLR